MKRLIPSALAGMLFGLGLVPAVQAMEILRWERLPLAVPLVVGQERVVFIDRNVRIGMPAGVGESLRVQSAGGAIYLRASKPIPSTRLQLQDVESGALILLDIAAEPAKAGQAALEPVRIVEGEAAPAHYGEQTATPPSTDDDTQGDTPASGRTPAHKRETPVAVVLTRFAAQNLYAPLRTVEPVAGIGRVNLRRDLPAREQAHPIHAAAVAGRGIRGADPARHRRRAGEGGSGRAGTGAHCRRRGDTCALRRAGERASEHRGRHTGRYA